MEYFVHIINYNKETQTQTKIIESYSTYDGALVRFHTAMRDGISNTKVAWCNTMITNQYGVIQKNEFWEEKQEPVSI